MNALRLGIVELFVFVILCAIAAAIALLLWGTIFKKAGYSRAVGLLMIIPLVNLITLIWFAVTKWPLEAEVERLRLGAGQPPMPPPYR
jgi:hypothetical protein